MPESRRAETPIDRRNPLVLDTRELGRRAGSMRDVRRSVPAPSRFGIDVVGVPEGSDLELDLRLEAVMEGVLVSGRARATVTGECVRCLDPIVSTVDADICELYAYPGHATADDDDVGRLQGDLLDLEPQLRDAVVLALPLRPICRDDCPGLCPTCGVRLAEEPVDHGHAEPDPRWAALSGVHIDIEQSER